MKRRDKKRIMIIGGIVSFIVMVSMIGIAIFSSEMETEEERIPGIEEYAEETINLAQVEDVMVNDGETVYWNIGRPTNGTDMILVTNIQVFMSWSDDERPPATRPFYENLPDTFYLTIVGVPLLSSDFSKEGNETNQTQTSDVARVTSQSTLGNTGATLNLLNNPVFLNPLEGGTNGSEWGWDPAGSEEKGNTGLYINVTCVAGDIVSKRPALLMYNDPGDEITMNVILNYKIIPEEIVMNWLENQKSKNNREE